MKRVKVVSAKSGNIRVSIKITVDAASYSLMRDEIECAIDALASDAMRSIESGRYIHIPISKVSVK